MPFKLFFSETAEKDLRKLDRSIRKQIVKKLEEMSIEDSIILDKVISEDCYKARVGDYRIFIDLDNEKKEFTILKVGHRKKIYR
ncbi:MAG: type II toxin-antitoxin system RelE family toxin [Candidatus Hodarchaeales archaeon]